MIKAFIQLKFILFACKDIKIGAKRFWNNKKALFLCGNLQFKSIHLKNENNVFNFFPFYFYLDFDTINRNNCLTIGVFHTPEKILLY